MSACGSADAQPVDPADHRDHDSGSAPRRAQIASPGRPGSGRDSLADGSRPRAPAALPGILTGTILGLSRAIGETAPLLMVARRARSSDCPRGPLDRYSALPVEIYNYAKEPDQASFRSSRRGAS